MSDPALQRSRRARLTRMTSTVFRPLEQRQALILPPLLEYYSTEPLSSYRSWILPTFAVGEGPGVDEESAADQARFEHLGHV